MRTFERFPETKVCPICKTNKDTACVLLVIDWTEDGNNNITATPAHVECLNSCRWRYNQEVGIVYTFIPEEET